MIACVGFTYVMICLGFLSLYVLLNSESKAADLVRRLFEACIERVKHRKG